MAGEDRDWLAGWQEGTGGDEAGSGIQDFVLVPICI